MKSASFQHSDILPSDTTYFDMVRSAIAPETQDLLWGLLASADEHSALWESAQGKEVQAGILGLLIDMLATGCSAKATGAVETCSPGFIASAHDLLLLAFFPDGHVGSLSQLDDAALLCLALLKGLGGAPREAFALLGEAMAHRDEQFCAAAQRLRERFAHEAPEEPFKAKLIIWDLDDTLWQGTLADGDEPVLHERRAAFVRAFNRHGIVSAICSKNDFANARERLEAFGLWTEFVFPRIAFLPKGEVVRQMITDMQLRPANVLFIDDNVRNLKEVAAAAPGISIIDATSPDCDVLLQSILDENVHVEKSRIADYRLLESKVAAREQHALTDEDFLFQSEIEATFTVRMDNLDFAERIEELINRSNQLNYTQSRAEPGAIRDRILDIDHHDVICTFVWDKYGYYGLVGVAVFDFKRQQLEHLAFSCRIMHMGVEDFMIGALRERGHWIDHAQLRKPLPSQSAGAIRKMAFSDPGIRARVLAEEAPRDWARIKLRLMADCQSGAFHHYSRFRDEADFDNRPRLFSLPMMMTGEYRDQSFPPYLMLTAATDYIDWRWEKLCTGIDTAIFAQCVDLFVDLVVSGERKCLLLLPPQDGPEHVFKLTDDWTPDEWRARHRTFNDLWRAAAARHPDHFDIIELETALAPDEMIHAYHYVPSAMRRMAGMIDDWYAKATDRGDEKPREAFKAKLVIWDLDDTLWQGTLADGHELILDEKRADYVRAFNRHGIVSAICSKNDHETAKARLEACGLWNEFVFARIAFMPKGEVVRQMIADMQLRSDNVLFIDDNVRNLQEVAAAVPGISIMDATSPDCDALLQHILDDNAHVAKSRVADYRLLETKVSEKAASGLCDEAFLRQSEIHAAYTHRGDNLAFAERIEDLINRSNQLNYTQSRVEPGSIEAMALNGSGYHMVCAFVWDRYGYYGLVGVAIYERQKRNLLHFALSCRVMHMGVEDFLLRVLTQYNGEIDLNRLHKPLPAQSADAITVLPFEDPEVRERILAVEAPHDSANIKMRIIADCQSGAFRHYSRFRDEIDFDNFPRVFELSMMLTSRHASQVFPGHIVYTPATDYMDTRWEALMPVIEDATYIEAMDRFCEEMIIKGGRKLLAFLPPENAPEHYYAVIGHVPGAEMLARNRRYNILWRAMAIRHPDRIRCIDLGNFVSQAEMLIHAYHYVPSVYQRIAGMIDDWYGAQAA
jgi:FkbH-like protein